MKTIDTIVISRWIVPIEPANRVLENHALAVDAGKIIAIAPLEEIQAKYTTKTTQHFSEHVILPGLINAHTHSPMVLFRGLADDLALMDWLQNHIWPMEKRWLDDEFVYDGTQLAMLEMIASGTTCFNENYFFGEGITKAIDAAKMRAVMGACIIDFPTAYANTPDEYIEKATRLQQTWQQHPLIAISFAPHAPYTISDETFLKIKSLADQHKMLIHLHLHETADEIAQSMQQYQQRPIARMAKLGMLSPRTQCIHMTQINEEDIELIKASGASIIHCPESNLKLASGFAPVTKFINAGINTGLGTDGACSNNDLDMFGEMQTAALLAKAVASDPTTLTAYETLRMATLNNAKALNLDHEIGSLVPGKAADMIAVQLDAINTTPIYNPISHLVYAVNNRQVTDVWVRGKKLFENRKFTTLDQGAILDKAKNWAQKIRQ